MDATAEILIDGELGKVPLREVSIELLLRCDPIRSFRWRHGQRHLPGWYWSATDRKHIAYESQLELARLRLADFDPEVVAIRSQPFRLTGRDSAGKERRHIPDFAVVHRDGLVRIINVKPAERLKEVKIREALDWAHGIFEANGFATELWSGETPEVLANIAFLSSCRNPALFSGEDIATATRVLDPNSTFECAESASRDAGIGEPRPVLLHLLWRGDVVTDLTQTLGPTSLLKKS